MKMVFIVSGGVMAKRLVKSLLTKSIKRYRHILISTGKKCGKNSILVLVCHYIMYEIYYMLHGTHFR